MSQAQTAPSAIGNAASLRLFVTLELPPPIAAELAAISARLQKGSRFTGCKLRWMAADGLHLTLAFLGEQESRRVEAFGAAIAKAAARYPPERLEIRGLGVFPHWHRPTALWAGVRDRSHRLAELHADLNRSLESLGYRPEARPFQPHITLARFKDYRDLGAIEKLAHEHKNFRIGPFEAEALALYRSEMLPEGARHTPLFSHRLSGPVPEPKECNHECKDEPASGP